MVSSHATNWVRRFWVSSNTTLTSFCICIIQFVASVSWFYRSVARLLAEGIKWFHGSVIVEH